MTATSRQRDTAALVEFLGSRAAMPHAWGRRRNDCLAFAAAAVKAQTGKDPAKGLRWTSERTALRLLAKLGGIEAVLDARFERVPVALAMRGDIAGVPAALAGTDPRLGLHPMLVEGETLCAPGRRGLKRVPRSAATAAWKIA